MSYLCLTTGGRQSADKTSLFPLTPRWLTAYRCGGRGNGDEGIGRSACQQERHLLQLGAGLEGKPALGVEAAAQKL